VSEKLQTRVYFTDRHLQQSMGGPTAEEINRRLYSEMCEPLLAKLNDGKVHSVQLVKEVERRRIFPGDTEKAHVHTLTAYLDYPGKVKWTPFWDEDGDMIAIRIYLEKEPRSE